MHPHWDVFIFLCTAALAAAFGPAAGAAVVAAGVVALKVRLARADRARAEGRWHDTVGSKLNQLFALLLIICFGSFWATHWAVSRFSSP